MKEDTFEELSHSNKKRQQKTLREFKKVLQNLIYLLGKATNADSAYLYWINRSRKQFVMEAYSTDVKNAHFQDRVEFKNHYFSRYKDIEKPVILKAGQDISKEALHRSNNEAKTKQIMLIPFINNEETIALTALEWHQENYAERTKIINTYTDTLGKLLSANLEVTALYKDQQEWEIYEKKLSFLNRAGHPTAILSSMMQTLQTFLAKGSVSLIANGMGMWCNLLNSKLSDRPLPAGLPVEKRTLVADALKNSSDEFAIHFNNNPKRISPREDFTEGASYAVPITFSEVSSAVVLINDENVLAFKESTKHKLKNIVRLTGLKIQTILNKSKAFDHLLINQFEAFIPDIWEKVIETEIERLKKGKECFYTWVGFATLSNLSEIRSQFRLEELKCLQKDVVREMNPGKFGTTGVIGSYSDYVYTVLIQSREPEALNHWLDEVKQKFNKPFELSNGIQINSDISTGFILLNEDDEDVYNVTQRARAILNS